MFSAFAAFRGRGRGGNLTVRIAPGVTIYAVHSFDNDAIQFSIPVLVRRPLFDEIRDDPAGAYGEVGQDYRAD